MAINPINLPQSLMHKPWQKVGGGAESILVLPGAFGPEDKFVLYGFHTCSRRMPECSRNRSRVRAALRALGWMVVLVWDF